MNLIFFTKCLQGRLVLRKWLLSYATRKNPLKENLLEGKKKL